MAEWIQIKAWAQIKKNEPGKEVAATPDELGNIANQMAADAVFGSFGEFSSDYWAGALSGKPADFANAEIVREDDSKVRLTLNINSAQYEMSLGGLQHLLG